MSKALLINRLKEIDLIYKKSVTLRSGIKSDYYCDIKKVFGYPDILNLIIKVIKPFITKKVTCIAGSGYGGLPLATIVAYEYSKKFVAVRDKSKKYGKKGKIEGYTPNKKDTVLILDDVLTTGSSIKATISALKKTKAKIAGAVVIVKRGNPALPIPTSYIFEIDELF